VLGFTVAMDAQALFLIMSVKLVITNVQVTQGYKFLLEDRIQVSGFRRKQWVISNKIKWLG
jgi:hypothetical protein